MELVLRCWTVLYFLVDVVEVKKTTTPRPIAQWSPWGDWDADCSKTCGIGVRRRHRTCLQPTTTTTTTTANPRKSKKPKNKSNYKFFTKDIAKRCEGTQASQSRNCDTGITCPIHGGWSIWMSWDCSVTCGGGQGKRFRKCNNPEPAFKGQTCDGPAEEFGKCNENPCPDQIFPLSSKTKKLLEDSMRTTHNNVQKNVGETAVIPCKKDLSGPIMKEYPVSKVYWTKNGHELRLNGSRIELTPTHLAVNDLKSFDSGVYVCRINYAPDVDKPIDVTALIVASHAPTMSVRIGSPLKLKCNAESFQDILQNFTQTWLHNDAVYQELDTSPRTSNDVYNYGPATANVSGKWTCQVTHPPTKRQWNTNMLVVAILPPLQFHEIFMANRHYQILAALISVSVLLIVGGYLAYGINVARSGASEDFAKWKDLVDAGEVDDSTTDSETNLIESRESDEDEHDEEHDDEDEDESVEEE